MSTECFDNLSVMTKSGVAYVEADNKVMGALLDRFALEGNVYMDAEKAYCKKTGKMSVAFINSILNDDEFIEVSGAFRATVIDRLSEMVPNNYSNSIVLDNKAYVGAGVLAYVSTQYEECEEELSDHEDTSEEDCSPKIKRKQKSLVVCDSEEEEEEEITQAPAIQKLDNKNYTILLCRSVDSRVERYFVAVVENGCIETINCMEKTFNNFTILTRCSVNKYVCPNYFGYYLTDLSLVDDGTPHSIKGAKFSHYFANQANEGGIYMPRRVIAAFGKALMNIY